MVSSIVKEFFLARDVSGLLISELNLRLDFSKAALSKSFVKRTQQI